MIDKDILKWDSQWPKSIQASAILMMFQRYTSFWMMFLICLQDNLSSLEVDALLYFETALLNSSSENSFQIVASLLGISSSRSMFIWWCYTELNNKWSACYKSYNSRYGWPSYWIASIAKSLCFFTQFMSS